MLFNKYFKISLIGSLFMPMIAVASNVTINGGELSFHGSAVAAPCSVHTGDVDKTVDMGQVRTNNFASKGDWYNPVAFDIHLEDCSTQILDTVAVEFNGISDANDPQVFQSGSGAGASQGVGLGIFDYTGRQLIPNSQPKNFMPLIDGENVLHFTAKYRATLNHVKSGDASASIWFKMIYQ